MRINFYTIFNINAEGSILPKEKKIKIGGVQFCNSSGFKNISFSGISSSMLIGRDLEVRDDNGIYSIIGIY